MAISITVTKIKESYLNIDMTTAKFDFMIALYITGVIESAINYLDDTNYTAQSNMPSYLEHRLCQQIAYEFRRRKDLGLSDVKFGDGSVQKFVIDEWLPSVEKALDRAMTITV